MANIKSAKKRILTSTKRAARNKSVRSEVKTAVKKVRVAVDAGDKAETKGVLHKNTASRKVSRLAQAVNKIG